MGLAAQGTRNNIHLFRDDNEPPNHSLCQFQPSVLAHVQIRLGKYVLQPLVISKDVDHIPKKIMLPCMQSKDNGSQLKIMSGIVLFMTPELSGGISNQTAFLHENTT
jgi:hypothetical protein